MKPTSTLVEEVIHEFVTVAGVEVARGEVGIFVDDSAGPALQALIERAEAGEALEASNRRTEYRVRWGDGITHDFDSAAAALAYLGSFDDSDGFVTRKRGVAEQRVVHESPWVLLDAARAASEER